ncbi:hypothetical protein SAMN06265368_3185 [Cohaesibacter gelatinilyticus]|uniref:Uncharacterized protein n=1 Tax=Cohaesibacter gelatinilyticus TaxID=372072 RepID=A0A285PIY4_9HYPH|nr:hypothetical protein SAMN06265368_3185 [Cohaesibacter gelatinilyticus]
MAERGALRPQVCMIAQTRAKPESDDMQLAKGVPLEPLKTRHLLKRLDINEWALRLVAFNITLKRTSLN